MLPRRLPVDSRLFIVRFWGSQKLFTNFRLYVEVGVAPKPHVIQRSVTLQNSLPDEFVCVLNKLTKWSHIATLRWIG